LEFASDIERWMRQALREAELAAEEGEVPVRVEALQDPTAHAEMLALTAATSTVGSWRLEGAQVYVTVEPCMMCVGALLLARVEAIFFGPHEPKFGACGSIIDAPAIPGWNHKLRVVSGILAEESASLLRAFFREKREEARGGTPNEATDTLA
jgi:tRNA(adenine34) deaminase